NVLLQKGAEGSQQGVAAGVRELRVEPFEVVDVEHDHTKGAAAAAVQLAAERLLHIAAVKEPGEGIAHGLFGEGFVLVKNPQLLGAVAGNLFCQTDVEGRSG